MNINSNISVIDLYFNKMENILNNDLIHKILTYINIQIIKKQKFFKNILNAEIIKYKNIYYNDTNFLIYRNNNNILLNNKNKKKNLIINLLK